MQVSFNPNVSFKSQTPQVNNPIQNSSAQFIAQPAANVTSVNTESEKRKGLREDISKIAKFFTTLSEMTKASFRAVGYGALTVAASLTGFWAFGAVPRGLKKGNNILDAFKHPVKNISKKGKVITALLGLGVASYHLIKGKLISNQRTANVDHQLKTGHRPA